MGVAVRARRARKLVIMAASLIGMTLPSWASHLEHKLAPPPLLLVQAFVNTLDLDLRTDVLAHADDARAWLADAGLRDLGQADTDFAADLQLARDVRESLRAMIAHNTDGKPLTETELRSLEQVTQQAKTRLEVTSDGQVRLETTAPAQRLGDGLAVGVARDHGPHALPDVTGQLEVRGEVRIRLSRTARPRVAQAGVGQPRPGFVGMRQHIGAQVQVKGVDERLHEQQGRRSQLVLQVGRPRGQRHADQASRHDHQLSRSTH